MPRAASACGLRVRPGATGGAPRGRGQDGQERAPVLPNPDQRADDRFDAWLVKERDDGGKPRGQAGPAAGRPTRQGRRPRR